MRLFGTDGIRGTANAFPMTTDIVTKVAKASGHILRPQGIKNPLVIIGKDTRLSGYTFEPALVAGFASVGWHVQLLGPLPTPAIAALTKSMRAHMGLMISASHNPYADNGLKIFGSDGFKISSQQETEIEDIVALLDRKEEDFLLAPPTDLGRVSRVDGSDGASGRYIELAKSSFPTDLNLYGMKLVLDCANGAGYRVAPRVLHELGAEVIAMGIDPNGTNINNGVGATAPAALRARVLSENADMGIALDGDADRLIIVDECGEIVNGDQILATLATFLQETNRLKGDAVVATLMSNLGLESYLKSRGVNLVRTPVGDRNVVSKMREIGACLGGEQSGHMIMSDYSTTGDGLVAALQVLGLMRRKGIATSMATKCFQPVPQGLRNIEFRGENPLENHSVQKSLANTEAELGARGRILVRKSGTECLLRLMVEAETAETVAYTLNELEAAVRLPSYTDGPKS